MTLEDIAECVPSLSFNELKELEAEIMQLLFTPGRALRCTVADQYSIEAGIRSLAVRQP